MLLLLKSACFRFLAHANPLGREDARTRYLEAQLTIQSDRAEEIVSAAAKADRKQIGASFREIYAEPFIQECYPAVTNSLILALFDILGPTFVVQLLRLMLEDPYQYRKGWPDLTIVNQHRLALIEVKTTDTLHESQLRTLPRIKQILGDRIAICQLSQSSMKSVSLFEWLDAL